VSVRNDSQHKQIAIRICGLWANIWNGTSQVRRRSEDDWNGTVEKARAEIENEAQVRIFGNNKKKNKWKGYTMRSCVISVVLFAYFLCH
jgi:hypothetical protein